jgi:hypothetical protein
MARKTGSAGVSDQGKGMGGVTREPERSRLCPHESNRHAERRVNNAPGLMTDLANVRSAEMRTRNSKACGIPKRSHKPTDVRGGKS